MANKQINQLNGGVKATTLANGDLLEIQRADGGAGSSQFIDIELIKDTIVGKNSVIVNSFENLPTPEDKSNGLGSCTYLEHAHLYTLSGNIINTHPIALENDPAGINGSGIFASQIQGHYGTSMTYIGSGAFLRANAASAAYGFVIDTTYLFSPGTNTLFDYKDANSINIFNSVAFNFASLGTCKLSSFITAQLTTFANFGEGLTITDTPIIGFNLVSFVYAAPIGGSLINLAGNIGTGSFSNMNMIPILGDSAFNIDPGLVGNITLNNVKVYDDYLGIPFNPAGINGEDDRVTISNCPGIKSSSIAIEAVSTVSQTFTVNTTLQKILIKKTDYIVDHVERISFSEKGAECLAIETTLPVFSFNCNIQPTSQTRNLSAGISHLPIASETTCTFTNATERINATAHGKQNGDAISFLLTAGTVGTGLRDDVVYYIINKTDNDFQVSNTSGGAAVTFTTDGTGTNSFRSVELVGLPGVQDIAFGAPRQISSSGIVNYKYGDVVIPYFSNNEGTQGGIITGYQILTSLKI